MKKQRPIWIGYLIHNAKSNLIKVDDFEVTNGGVDGGG